MASKMRTPILLLLSFLLVIFGLKAQSREKVINDCSPPVLHVAKEYTYHSLILGEEYFISFPHNIETESSTSLFSTKQVKKVYWSKGKLYFTAKTNEIVFYYPGLDPTKQVINCNEFYVTPASNMKMMGIITEKNTPIETLIERDLLGDFCLQVTGIDGPNNSNRFGTFSNGSTSINIEDGIVLATGNINSAEGPNDGVESQNNGTDGSDPDIAAIIGNSQHNVTKIEFDFVPDEDMISFDYVFASEEYCDYVNSQFNDVFGFFISGPGIAGPYTNGAENIAIIPGTTLPVTINNVNWGSFSEYYNTNELFPSGGGCTAAELGAPKPFADLIGFDGFTSVFQAESPVIPCETYHIKLVIADIGDPLFDSGIFLAKNSFISGDADTKVTVVDGVKDGSEAAEEGCENAYIAFGIDPPSNFDIEFTFEILGTSTATEGVDFENLPNTYTISAGEAIDTLWIDIFGDILLEGIETIDIKVVGLCDCDDPTITIQIQDPPTYLKDVTICQGEFYDSEQGPLTEPGEYLTVLETPGACDSLVLLTLDVLPTIFFDTTIYRCFPDPLEYEGLEIPFAPALELVLYENASRFGCDSVQRVQFYWANPDLIPEVSDSISCDNPEVKIYPDGFIPNTISTFSWVTPDLDTIIADTLYTSIPGEYQLLSYIELDDQICQNIIPRNIEVFSDSLVPILSDLDDITVYCDQAIDDITAEIQNADDLPDLVYEWTGPNGFNANTITVSLVDTGLYTFSVENLENGCISEDEFFVVAQEVIPTINIADAGLGCDAPSIYLQTTVDIPGGDFSWIGPNGFSSTDQSPEVTEIGTYTVEYSLSPSCVNIDSIEVLVDNTIPIVDAIGDTIICNQGTGLITFSADDVADFMWTGPNGFTSTEQSPEVTVEGNYTIEILASNGCSNSADVSLDFIDIIPFIEAEDGALTCTNPLINLQIDVTDTSLIYDWSGPNGFSSAEMNPQVSESGMYTIEVLNEEGCTETQTVMISIDTLTPILSLDDAMITCVSNVVTLEGETLDDLVSFSWTGPNGFESTEESITTGESGSYYLEVQAVNGCTAESSAIVVIDTLPPSYIVVNDTLDCNTGEATISVILDSTNIDIVWFDPNNIEINSEDNEITVSNDGSYTVYLSDTENFCETEATILVTPNELTPDISLDADLITCANQTFNINSSSSFSNLTYVWTGPNGFTSSDSNPAITEGGSYTLEIISDQDCRNEGTVIVETDLETPDVTVEDGELNCLIEELALNLEALDGSYQYSWTSNNGFTSTENNPVVDEEGIYTAMVVGPNFCDTTVTLEITADQESPLIEENISNSLNCNTPESTITITTNLPNDATYAWDGPMSFSSNLNEITVSEGGNYTVTITSANGCSNEETFNLDADFTTIDIATINGNTNCNFPVTTLQASLSSNDYFSLNWEGPNAFTSQELNPEISESGIYTLYVTALNGCQSEGQVIITSDFAEPVIELNSGELSCSTESVTISNSLHQQDFTYLWIDPNETVLASTSSTIDAQVPGMYEVLVTNSVNGCIANETTVVTELPDIQSFAFETDNPDCFNPTGFIAFTDVEGGTEPFQYSINGGVDLQSDPIFNNLSAGTFELLIVDEQDCSQTAETAIVSLQDFELKGDGPFEIFVGENQQLNVETSLDPIDIDSIEWTPNNDLSCTNCLNPISSTTEDKTYTVTVTDKDGCVYETTITIRVLENPYYVPNVFSPNDDGINEYFSIFGPLELITNVNEFSIYDRWGERVFYTEDVLATDESMKWYGDFKGEDAQVGVYAYYIEFISFSGNLVMLTGDVTIIR